MTIERYSTPNHPRWYPQTTGTSTKTARQRRYGREYSHPDGHRTDEIPRSDPPSLLSRDATQDETTIDLRDTSNRVWITTELPDRSIDDIHVSVSGASIRIRAEASDEPPRENDLDRTIALTETVDPADVVIAYDEPTLTVIVPNENQ